MTDNDFALYVSINPENPVPVSRFGSGMSSRSNTLIGGVRDVKNPRKITYDPEKVVGIRAAEYSAHRREYNRAIKNGDLVKRNRADFDESEKKAAAAAKLEGEKRAAEKKAAAEEAKKVAKKTADVEKAKVDYLAKAEAKAAKAKEASAAKAAKATGKNIKTGSDANPPTQKESKAPTSKSTKASS